MSREGRKQILSQYGARFDHHCGFLFVEYTQNCQKIKTQVQQGSNVRKVVLKVVKYFFKKRELFLPFVSFGEIIPDDYTVTSQSMC